MEIPTCLAVVITLVFFKMANTGVLCPDVACTNACPPKVRSNDCSCECRPTCQDVICAPDEQCVMEQVVCIRPPCFPVPTCLPKRNTTPPPCLDVKCAAGCVSIKGQNGCRFCACPPTCKDMKCAKDETCVLKQIIQCLVAPCFPTPSCVPNDKSLRVRRNCAIITLRWFYNRSTEACQRFRYFGCAPSPNTFDSRKECEEKYMNPCGYCGDDCYTLQRKNQPPKCICPNPCKDFNCSDDEVCKSICVKEPCDPRPYCGKNSCPAQPPCAIRCTYGLKTDEDGCQLCECCKEPKQTELSNKKENYVPTKEVEPSKT